MKIHHYTIGCLFVISGVLPLSAQGVHNIYSFVFKNTNNEYTLTLPKYLSSYNTNGYNNQPSFKNGRSIYLTSKLRGEDQTEIYALNLYNNKKAQVTRSPESEYSPQLRPGTVSFNCVRVESDGVTQRLWQFPTDHSTQGKPLFPDVKNVGYYQWLDADQVALFLVGEPHSLVIGDTRDGSIKPITSNIGRGMGLAANGDLLFIQKLSERTWYIKQLEVKTQKSNIVTETLEGAEDFVVMPDGAILMAKQSQLYRFDSKSSKSWTKLADLSKYGLHNISRLAFNNERLLVLVNEVK